MFIYSGNRPFNIDFIFDYSLPATLVFGESVALGAFSESLSSRRVRNIGLEEGALNVDYNRQSLPSVTSDIRLNLYTSIDTREPQVFSDSEDASGGALQRSLCSIIEKNKTQLSVFRQLCFRDSETQTLLVQGTEELIRNLEKLKRFLKIKENTKT